MGQPLFQIQDLVRRHQIKVFSSNYELYGDLSRRVMAVIEEYVPRLEVYSIDEAFVDLTGIPLDELAGMAAKIRQAVKQRVGIPVSIGIGQTKTLAKIGNDIAKKRVDGVCLLNPTEAVEVMAKLPVEEIWGIGAGFGARLARLGIHTADDLRRFPCEAIRRSLGVVGERVKQELNGNCALVWEDVPPPKKSLACSNSLGQAIVHLSDLEDVFTSQISRAAARLRRHSVCTGCLTFFVGILQNSRKGMVYAQKTLFLDPPTADTPSLLNAVLPCLRQLFQNGKSAPVKRLGIIFTELDAANQLCFNFDQKVGNSANRTRLMEAVDQLNRKFGASTVQFGIQPGKSSWRPKAAYLSPRATTRWPEIPVVKV